MSYEEDVIFNLEVNVEEATKDITELNRLFTTYLSLARRSGLPENIIEALARIQQLRVAIQTLYTSILLLEAASGPIGWLTAIGGVTLGAAMLTDQMLVGSRTR